MSAKTKKQNESRCPYEKVWYCELLKQDCHPGISGCILSGQPLIDALLAYERKEGVTKDPDQDES